MINAILVDDHELFRLGVKTAITNCYQDIHIVGEAETGKDFFHLLETHTADIVLLDVILPDMSGIEIARRLKKEKPNLKILIISSENTANITQELLNIGVDGFISKRMGGMDVLAEAIRSIMTGFEYFGKDISDIIYRIYVSKKRTTEITAEFSEQEKKIIELCRDGISAKKIANCLNISSRTVDNHKKNIFQKLGIHSTLEMVGYAMKNGIIAFLALLCFLGCNSAQIADKQPIHNLALMDSIAETDDALYMDSLLLLATHTPPDTNLVWLYHQIGEKFEDSDFEKAKEYYLKMRNLCDQLNWNQGRYLFTIDYSHILIRGGAVDSAITVNLKALELAKNEHNELWIGRLSYSTGNAYLLKQWFEIALEYYLNALTIFEKNEETERLGSVYSQLCQLYTDINITEKAIEFGEKAIAINPDCPYSLASLSQAYSSVQQYEKANKYLEEALRLCVLQNNIYLIGIISYHLGCNFLNTYDFAKSEIYARKALDINLEIGNKIAYLGALTLLSKFEKLKGNFFQSEIHIKEALQIAIELDDLKGKNDCYMILAELAIAQKKYQENVRYWKDWELVNKEIASEITLRTAAEMETKYESAKKELEIGRQKNIIEKQELQQWMYVGGIAFCVIFIILLWYMLNLRIHRNRALEELNNTKDRFFSIISHDLKNPALAQRDAISILLNDEVSLDAKTLKNYYQTMLQSADSQINLLYNLLNWAKVQTGRIFYYPIEFDLAAQLRKNDFSLLRNMASHKEIAFIVKIPDTALITGDVNLLDTVVRNLLENALKFTPKGGTVTLEVGQANNTTPTTYRISITDTGIGMTGEQIQNLFRLDRQNSKYGTAGEVGTGLGLIVCKELLEKHGTTLHAESEPNKGSRFWFEI
jgi:DNA-binding NarL/FixJ family response regulator/signal transduction histidine kinase